MNINFHFGELIQYYSDNESLIANGFISTITSLIVFGIGFYVKARFEKRKEKQNAKEKFRFVEYLLVSLDPNIKKQIKGYTEFSQKILERKNQDIFLVTVSELNTDHLKKIDLSDVYSELVYNNKNIDKEDLKNILGFIDYIEESKKQVQVAFNNYLELRSNNFKIWNFNVEEIRKELESNMLFYRATKTPHLSDTFFIEFDRITADWQKTFQTDIIENPRDPFFLLECYIAPLKELCKVHLHDKRAVKVLNFIAACEAALLDLEQNSKGYSNYFLELSKLLEEKSLKMYGSLNKIANAITPSPNWS